MTLLHDIPRRGWACLGLGLALLAVQASPAPAQSAIDELNRILGREVEPRRERTRPERTRSRRTSPSEAGADASTRPRARRGVPRPTRSVDALQVPPARGAIGYVDYALLVKLHPVMRYLRIRPHPRSIPVFVKNDQARSLAPPPSVVRAEKAKRQTWRSERNQLQQELNVLYNTLKALPRTVAEALEKLPRRASAARRREAEDSFYAQKATLKERIDLLAIRMGHLDAKLRGPDRPGVALNREYFRRIRQDIDAALRAEFRQRQLALILNIPGPDRYSSTEHREAEADVAGITNHFAEFMATPASRTGEAGVQISLLAQWAEVLDTYQDFLPEDIGRPDVLMGGVDLTPSVLERVWAGYEIEKERIEVAKRFLRAEF